MPEDYMGLLGGMNQNQLAMDFGVNVDDLDLGAVDKMLGGGVDLQGATSLYGGLGGGIGLGEIGKNVVPATSPVLGIPGVNDPVSGGLGNFASISDGNGGLMGIDEGAYKSMMAAGNEGMANLTNPSMTGSDMYGMLSKGTQGLGGLMGLYNSWQMMNIMNKNEARNQKGFDLANERYDTNHANVKNAFAV